MNLKKRSIIFSTLLIVIIQILLYTNNSQKTSFRYFVWTLQDVSIGKLISISFFSGLFISSLLNTSVSTKKHNFGNIEENHEQENNEEEIKSNMEIPPQRDIRETQPSISVNYRVVKNSEDNNFKRNQNNSNSPDNSDDWNNNENDW